MISVPSPQVSTGVPPSSPHPLYSSASSIYAASEVVSHLKLIGADAVKQNGAGITVGIIDTGIDYTHPALGGRFGPGARVRIGYDFADNDADPRDPCQQHGTHVAGIIGATPNGQVAGVAPNVSFAAYRVFGCSGSGSDDAVVKAVDRAAADRVPIINLSLGDSYQFSPSSPLAISLTRYSQLGGFAVVAAGNDGPDVFALGSPADVRAVTSVGSVINPAFRTAFFRAAIGTDAPTAFPMTLMDFSPTYGVAYPLSRTGSFSKTDDACSTVSGVSNTVALIRRGNCTFTSKALNAQTAGATAVIIYFFDGGSAPPAANSIGLDRSTGLTIPVIITSVSTGQALDTALAAGQPVTVTFLTGTDAVTDTVLGGRMSAFSSAGPAGDLGLDPSVSAPGENILSTVPGGGTAVLSGTSMATPMVAGAAALMLQAYPTMAPSTLRGIFQSTAEPVLARGLSSLESVWLAGAGIIRVDRAIRAPLSISPSAIEVGDFAQKTVTLRVSLLRPTSLNLSTVFTFDIIHEPANTFVLAYSSGFTNATATVSLGSKTITLSRTRTSTTITVSIVAANGILPRGAFYSGFVSLRQRGGAALTFRVPYGGLAGDYPRLFPLVRAVVLINGIGQAVPANASFSFTSNVQMVGVIVALNMPVQQVLAQIMAIAPDGSMTRIDEGTYVEVPATKGQGAAPLSMVFDGQAPNFFLNRTEQYPPGYYRLRVTVDSFVGAGKPNSTRGELTWDSALWRRV